MCQERQLELLQDHQSYQHHSLSVADIQIIDKISRVIM